MSAMALSGCRSARYRRPWVQWASQNLGAMSRARARLTRALDIAPRFWLAHCTQGLLYLADRQPDKAIADMRRGVALADGTSRPSALLATYLARLGQADEARTILNQLLTLAKT